MFPRMNISVCYCMGESRLRTSTKRLPVRISASTGRVDALWSLHQVIRRIVRAIRCAVHRGEHKAAHARRAYPLPGCAERMSDKARRYWDRAYQSS